MDKPLVAIIMGSDSDLDVMKDAAEFLETFGIKYEMTIVSAHRTLERMVQYAKEARTRGINIIIAGAGGAAHLPGMVASLTELPVIGVPIGTKLDGLDSLLSIVQMPAGIPVATVGINAAKNAAILACEILGIKHQEIAEKVSRYKQKMQKEIKEKAVELELRGFREYQKQKKQKI